VYAKALSGGQAESPLSTEEARAVEQALAGPGSNAGRSEVGRPERARPAS
jgi:hypothetical protein